MKLTDKVATLKGVGPAIEKGLADLNIYTVQDLLQYFPRDWEDYSTITRLREIVPGRVAVHCTVEMIQVRRSQRNRRLTITEAILTDGSGTIKAVWFNQPFLANTLKENQRYLFAGNFEFRNNYLSLNSPTFELASEDNFAGKIYPVYKQNSTITSKTLTKLVAQALPLASELNDDLLESIEEKQELISYPQAIAILHQPKKVSDIERAKERIGFGELFDLFVAGLSIKDSLRQHSASPVPFDLKVVEGILQTLNFELTDAQRKAAWQILQDLQSDTPMNRLLEGDVGSGKTLVAILATAMTVNAGFQVALMVPTEILARQHLATLTKLFAHQAITPLLLIGSLNAKEKQAAHTTIQNGQSQIVIGTHALLSEKVEFAALGLIIIDEQHRFGVDQRKKLKSKAHNTPHVLTMTATPIPRSLALVVYADLDVSIIDALPPGRKTIETRLVTEADRTSVYLFVDQLITRGQQAFVVCPTIEDNATTSLKSVKKEYERLKKTIFTSRRIALLHGRMKAQEKEQIMADFRNKKYDILLATTVIEVGVDVPNATAMIIENSERFGLAALHQLRGRVGRGGEQSHFYLFYDTNNPKTYERLKSLEKTSDGFRLAEIDLSLRGPGEIYGTAQHGVLKLQFANITNAALLTKVKAAATAFLKDQNMVKYPKVAARIEQLQSLTSLD